MNRKPFEGVWNVVRFNWHFYVIVFGIMGLILAVFPMFPDFYQALSLTLVFIMIMPVLISLFVTYQVYDNTSLYEMEWLEEYGDDIEIASFNAGFDETTLLMRDKKPQANVTALDFYDPEHHTEISIKRANKAYPHLPGTLKIKTNNIPLEENSIDLAVGFLSMHEIRDKPERIMFFKNLQTILKEEGEIVIIEHLRDIPNFLAYNIGFVHFLSAATWQKTFKEAGFVVKEEKKINPLMTKFTLTHGTAT